ncbi:glutathione synthase [Natronospirillum operosum]|uniref:Glutathione synthetase n=1 Tax=Natronospirillum operosum TaxID=2759953 RepID=A0A4Z0W415_9GAMM|nr:glutathione synthase [Natronospirillum operosum]TGG91482.1 glutathione synthase [Natronospirillum operosum]
MHVGFLIEDWANLEPGKSSTLLIMQECLQRGYKVSVLYVRNLTVRNNVVYGFVKRVRMSGDKVPEQVATFFKRAQLDDKLMPLQALDVIFIRKDPPIDPITYNFLDSVKDLTMVVNEVDGLRKANNKLYTTTFHDPHNEFLPVTHVSKNKDYLLRMIQESEHDRMILKPLDGSGGRGVIVLERRAMTNINSLLDFYIDGGRNYVILQEYIEGADQGDVRVLMLNGRFIGAYNRKPAEGEFRANIQTGGTAHAYTMTASQKRILRKVGPKLARDGLYFVGLDMIGDKILEVNVCNPGGITNINRLNKVKLQRQVVDFLEEKVHERHQDSAEMHDRLARRHQSKQDEH